MTESQLVAIDDHSRLLTALRFFTKDQEGVFYTLFLAPSTLPRGPRVSIAARASPPMIALAFSTWRRWSPSVTNSSG